MRECGRKGHPTIYKLYDISWGANSLSLQFPRLENETAQRAEVTLAKWLYPLATKTD